MGNSLCSEELLDITEIDIDTDSLRNTTPKEVSLKELYNSSAV